MYFLLAHAWFIWIYLLLGGRHRRSNGVHSRSGQFTQRERNRRHDAERDSDAKRQKPPETPNQILLVVEWSRG